ncbi:HAD-IA family hydrolase [Candidatus Bathyarchaeota archaeon]|jgi:phosphoglycolate phosphatase|nr:HAD-IA family hydrolase [Candidatus Bathyarchaeota archaeon]MBT4320555.1 HAD-IA family hydrolase [Candidatus Bathyarchaeota archaeon]MBT4423505.1 HAD-IA family hydrolase [Candidatus Bathyarchaeota archaeon]MBT6604794.1 HAD-IA family hydrolase [Candidatus Bathyarchaeota archaeon]MBT7188428.1 HAD-IA family hydrolase [Candidatus Bathyarchaeota archaeon]
MLKLMINGRQYSPTLILFDVDGTLVDDSHRYSNLGKARYTAYKENVSGRAAKQWARLSGVNPEDWTIDPTGPISKAPRRDDLAIAGAALYLEGFNWYDAKEKAEELYGIADKIQAETFVPELYEGVKEKMVELLDAGFKLGIATNGETGLTDEILVGLGIRELFSVIVGADKVENSKPAPDMILLACNRIGVSVSETMYVGDQHTDIRAAKAAGAIAYIAVRNQIEEATENTSSVADFVI